MVEELRGTPSTKIALTWKPDDAVKLNNEEFEP